MIYTITFNPSIDYVVRLDKFQTNNVNRVNYEEATAGGKGLNVSIVLKNLGHESIPLGFVAGFTGKEIIRQLASLGIKHNFIELNQGFSRINIKLKAKDETEINGQGPAIPSEAQHKLFKQIDTLIAGDILVLAGSIPNTLPNDIYSQIMKRLENRKINIVVDATKELLLNTLAHRPYLIKPNKEELGELFAKKLNSDEEIIQCAKKLQEKGAKNIIVSLAGDGAILLTEDTKCYKCTAPRGTVINSVGAGDSLVAGFIAGIVENTPIEKAFLMGVATGSASAFSNKLATREEMEALFETLVLL